MSVEIVGLSASTPSTEFDFTFIQRMADRMSMSFRKYGPVAEAYPENVDALETALLKIKLYKQTGNKELLVDVANYVMIESMHPKRKGAAYKPSVGGKQNVRVWEDGEVSQRANDFTPQEG